MIGALLLPATVLLAPLLIWQGRQVRRVTPQLPAPPGERTGRIGAGRPLRLLILGDSAAAGVGAVSQSEALSGQLAQRLGATSELHWRLIAQTGHRARDVLRELAQAAGESYDVALLSIGVNDVTALASARTFARDANALVDRLTADHGVRLVVLSGLPPMGEFPALPQPLRWRLGAQARQLDRQLAELAQRHPLCVHLPFGPLPDPSVMASDGFHPGPAAYALWAQAASERIGAWRERSTSET